MAAGCCWLLLAAGWLQAVGCWKLLLLLLMLLLAAGCWLAAGCYLLLAAG
jgi:hypothetical protein